MDNEKEKKYESIDVQGMAEYLAKDSFNTRTKDIPHDDLFPTEISDNGEGMKVEKEMHSKWVLLMFSLVETWREFIYQFKKPDNEESNKEQRPE